MQLLEVFLKLMNTHVMFVEIAVAMPVFQLYTYIVPAGRESIATPGKRVIVPFGIHNRRVTGYVMGESAPKTDRKYKEIIEITDGPSLFPSEMVGLFKWVSQYYLYPIGEVVKGALPQGLHQVDQMMIELTDEGRSKKEQNIVTSKEAAIVNQLHKGKCTLMALRSKIDTKLSPNHLKRLEEKGWIRRFYELTSSVRVKTERYVTVNRNHVDVKSLTSARRKVIETLTRTGEIAVSELKKEMPSATRLLSAMSKNGQLIISKKAVYRDPFGVPVAPDAPLEVTEEQQEVIRQISENLDRGFRTWLLAGVTGSGKTEIYLQLARKVIELERTVLVLVPEIALISQIERCFRARFGENIAILHSGLTRGERFDQWRRILKQKAPIVVGARSAVFAPLKNLGLVIVDEEHDPSYKQEGGLHYHGRDVAVMRAKISDCPVILGSATPSLQSYYNAKNGKYHMVMLTRRVENRSLAEVTVVDLRKNEGQKGAHRFISPELKAAMTNSLANGQQVLLFLNRRGYASRPLCASCGTPLKCENCEITLTLHKKANAYKCHYCGYHKPAVCSCPICGSERIQPLGLGTEKVEQTVQALFPDAIVGRLDRDTTVRKGALIKVLKDVRNRKIDVLIGTQMVAKGHDFPNISLVGILCADLSLGFPDFRAGESTFQLLAQVSGRAGRGDVPGRVILQTFNPDHYAITTARYQHYKAFYSQEIQFRKALEYPPFTRMIQIKVAGKDESKTRSFAAFLGEICADVKGQGVELYDNIDVLGPIEAPFARVAGFFRWQILLKSVSISSMQEFLWKVMSDGQIVKKKAGIRFIVDVDPLYFI